MSCGGDHTLALSESGKVYAFGQSTNGQLGLGIRTLETSIPLQITSLSDLPNGVGKIKQISCGENHTSVVSNSGQLFTFGDGRHGKLCLDTETLSNHYTPVLSPRFRGFNVISAHCGGCHTMVLAQPLPPEQRLESIAENEDNNADDNDVSMNAVNEQHHAQDVSVSVNGNVGSMNVPCIALHNDINVEARMRHRRASDQKLPPIRSVSLSEDINMTRMVFLLLTNKICRMFKIFNMNKMEIFLILGEATVHPWLKLIKSKVPTPKNRTLTQNQKTRK